MILMIDPQAIIKSQTSLKKTTVKEKPTISLSVKETQEQSDKLLDKAISENIIDVKKLEKEAEQEELDEAELLDALEKVSSPKLTIGEAASYIEKNYMILQLNNCKCCERHQVNKPKILEKYIETNFKSDDKSKYNCQCQCRHIVRFICRSKYGFNYQ